MAAMTSSPKPGLSAGCWYAWPSTHVGYGGSNGKPLDYDELERWTTVGYERGMRSPKGER
jgi:hypothetical protein